MTILTDYRVLQDGKTFLRSAASGGPTTLTLPIVLPGPPTGSVNPFTDIGITPPPAHLPTLAFIADTVIPGNLQFKIETSNAAHGTVLQFTATYNTDVYQTLHEVINLDTLEAGANNVVFTVQSGTGLLGIGDVVLWFKRIVTALDGVD